MKNPLPKILIYAFIAVALTGCGGLGIILAGEGAAMVATKSWGEPPADTEHQMAEHEDWCYGTMAQVDCYAVPRDFPPTRLVNVNPQNRRPLNTHGYNEALAQAR